LEKNEKSLKKAHEDGINADNGVSGNTRITKAVKNRNTTQMTLGILM
jgi:hypothetical protein